MSEIYQLPVTGPSAWKARDFETNQSWIREFTADELDELHTATLTLKATGKGPEEFGPDDFPLPAFSRTIAEIHNELAEGRGFVLLRGIDVDRYDQETLELMFWGFQAHLGTIISQNSKVTCSATSPTGARIMNLGRITKTTFADTGRDQS